MERCFKHKPNKHINQHIKCDSYHDYSNMDWWIQIYIYIIQVTNPYYQMGPGAAAQLLSTPRQPGPRPTARRCPANVRPRYGQRGPGKMGWSDGWKKLLSKSKGTKVFPSVRDFFRNFSGRLRRLRESPTFLMILAELSGN
jgi:hypothetical protein